LQEAELPPALGYSALTACAHTHSHPTIKIAVKFPLFLCLAALAVPNAKAAPAPADDPAYEAREARIKHLEERLALVEAQLEAVLRERTSSPLSPVAPALVTTARTQPPIAQPKEITPPELLPEIGKVGAEVGLIVNQSFNPFHLNKGFDGAGFIDLPLFDKPAWLHGKLSYEISIGLSRSQTTFATTSNVAQVASLAVLNALSPTTGLQNITDSVTGTGAAPFPVTAQTTTTMKLLQVIPFSLKYTNTSLDRYRLRPYAILGVGTYVTIHEQSAPNTGVRQDANLSPAVLALVNQFFGGQSPFGGQLIAGQITQSPQLEARGLPSGHGNIDPGWLAGGGVEFRISPGLSFGIDSRWNRIAGAPGSLVTLGGRIGLHF
jgi:hypothetical protein